MTLEGYTTPRPPLRGRLWRRLGFGVPAPPIPDPLEDGFADCLIVNTMIRLTWSGRLRALVSGRVAISSAIQTEVPIGRSKGRTSLEIAPPGSR